MALEHRPEAVMLCHTVGGPIVQIIMGVLIMKQKNGESNSAKAQKERSLAQYIVGVKLDGSTQKAESIKHEGTTSMTAPIMLNLTLIPCRIMLETDLPRATLECYREFIKKPGAIESL
ncbi:MAG: hypothetical protein ACLSHJ_05800 [Oscillospiraceae bacterium]